MYKAPIKKEVKEEILSKVKEGKDTVPTIAKMYGISPEAIYYWLRQGVGGITSQVLSNNRLQKENETLKRIIGELILENNRGKKSGHN
jgi:transposase-like protein